MLCVKKKVNDIENKSVVKKDSVQKDSVQKDSKEYLTKVRLNNHFLPDGCVVHNNFTDFLCHEELTNSLPLFGRDRVEKFNLTGRG